MDEFVAELSIIIQIINTMQNTDYARFSTYTQDRLQNMNNDINRINEFILHRYDANRTDADMV